MSDKSAAIIVKPTQTFTITKILATLYLLCLMTTSFEILALVQLVLSIITFLTKLKLCSYRFCTIASGTAIRNRDVCIDGVCNDHGSESISFSFCRVTLMYLCLCAYKNRHFRSKNSNTALKREHSYNVPCEVITNGEKKTRVLICRISKLTGNNGWYG